MKGLNEEQIQKLINIAKKKTADEESSDEFFNPCDAFGGNYDDAYYGGIDDGEIQMARQVLDMLNIEY